MGFIDKYPYTDFHEMNLDWVINQVQTNATQILGIDSRTTDLEDKMKDITVLTEDYVRSIISSMIASDDSTNIYPRIEAAITTAESYTDTAIVNHTSDMLKYINAQDDVVKAQAKDYADDAEEAANDYTDKAVHDIDSMINPFTGSEDSVQDVINDIISRFHSDSALTAAEYDSYEKTASEYDALEITAFNYDFFGKNYIN